VAGLAIPLLAWSAQADPSVLFSAPNLLPLRCQPARPQYRVAGGNVPGFLYQPGETVTLALVFQRGGDAAEQDYRIEIQGVHTRKPNKAKEYIDPYGFPDILNLDGPPVHHPVRVRYGDQAEAAFEVASLPVPERFGAYCLVLLKGDERILLGSVARVMATRADGTAETAPILGDAAILGGFQDRAEAARAYVRMGIRWLRCEMGMRNPRADGTYDWDEYDRLTRDIKAGGMQAMFILGATGSRWYDIPTNDQPIPAAVNPDWDGSPYGGNADWGCGLRHFDAYEAWVKEFCGRYWEGGKGALWGLENYNEPWEGGGISGYARDSVAYREWQRRMARAARAVSPDIRICAASSIMNTEDKFYSDGPLADGTYEMNAHLDVFTDHYVAPYGAYGPMVAAKHGKISMENETWLAISEYLLPQIMCQWMACGQVAVKPFHPNALFDRLEGSPQKFFFPTTVPVATAAFNHFVTGMPFEKLVFQDHLPWAFQFGKDDDPRGLCVVFGQLLTRGGPTPQDSPEGRLWRQVDAVDGGEIALDNRDGALRFFDVAGNPVHEGQETVTLALDMLPTYIQSARGPALVAERLREAKIAGKYPAEIFPRDFTRPVTDPALELRVEVANRLNRAIAGTLTVSAPEGFAVKDNGRAVTLAAGETKTVRFSFSATREDEANRYPFAFAFATDAGDCAYRETLNCTVARRLTPAVDGDLAEWAGIPGITLVGKAEGIDADELARRPWLRLRNEIPAGAMVANLRMAWDDGFVYIAAQVSDDTPQTDKVRMENRDEDSYFHSAASDTQEPWKSWLAKHAPGQSFAAVPYIYKKKPFDNSYTGDQLQLAFNVRDDWHDLKPVTAVPVGFHAYPDTDYEFCAYLCADGGSELWNILTPDMPRIHDWPHQVKGRVQPNPASGAKHAIRQDGRVRTYEIAIPRALIPELEPQAGTTFRFAFFVGNDNGPKIRYGEGKAVTKTNALSLHPYWESSPSCQVEWALAE
jgi:hypothetical protein